MRLFSGQQKGLLGSEYVQPQETFPHLALVKTYTTNDQTPDSAPTAGAMNSGVKQKNGMINIDPSADHGDCAGVTGHELTTFAEIVSGEGKSIGVISNARLTHATPAAVYAKTANRNWATGKTIPSCWRAARPRRTSPRSSLTR
ncbi:alkaline phosphatase [Breoghania sp.]|uniref:alkaline phosphatase n=1 Tax=Breoghania sp. TaxID=2065378 RepID=UPI00260D64C6|nr:alkaline phosphatase [Breoghania sp.]MDJ0932334.1 alkaline phosphatase [Breoghania sp.]